MKKTATIKLQGKDYAQVKDRVMEFRQDCPNGLIETTPTLQDDGQIMFKARVLKDKGDETSAEASGHSIGKNAGQKAFEKLETIAVGRALALLGYASDGEIASSEEMEEFEKYQDEKKGKRIEDATSKLKKAKSLKELQEVWSNLDAESKVELTNIKDEVKAKYEDSKIPN